MSEDIVDRIRGLRYVHVPAASQLFEEAVTEIEKLRSLTRFQDRVIRSGDTACLTSDERMAIGWVLGEAKITSDFSVEATLRGLLERLK